MYRVDDFAQVCTTLLEPTLLKLTTAALLAFSFLFGDLYNQALVAILMLIIFDTILGIWAAYREQQPITSRRFSRVITKSIVYLMAISGGYFVDTTIPGSVFQATMIGFIAVTEFISVLENMGRLGVETPKKLLNQLKDFKSQK